MARGAAVFARLTRWVEGWNGTDFDLRSYGKPYDGGVQAVEKSITRRQKHCEGHPGDWTHVDVGEAPNSADLALAQDVADRSQRPEKQTLVIASSDAGETLRWVSTIAEEAPVKHRFQVVLGPSVIHPEKLFGPNRLPRLVYAGTVSQIFADVCRSEKQGAVGRKVTLNASVRDMAWQHARQRLTGDALGAYLRKSPNELSFVNRLRDTANLLERLPALSKDEKHEFWATWPEQALTTWRRTFRDLAEHPAYASTHVSQVLGPAEGHVALAALAATLRHAHQECTGEWVADAVRDVSLAEEKRRGQLPLATADI